MRKYNTAFEIFTDMLLRSNSFARMTPRYLLILILGKMGKGIRSSVD